MVKILLQDLLDREDRNLAWVSKKTGLSYPTLHKLNGNNTTSINFNTIEKLCELFDCEIQDIIRYTKE